MILVDKEKLKVKLALTIPTVVPITVVNEIIDIPPFVALFFYVFLHLHLLLMLLPLILKELKHFWLITFRFFINGGSVFNNGPSNLIKNPPD